MRADLRRLKRELDSGRSAAASSTPLVSQASATPGSSAAAPVAAISDHVRPVYATSRTSAAHPISAETRVPGRTLLIPVLVVLAALAAVSAWYLRAKSAASQIESIAVIPFSTSSGTADSEFLSDGLSESLIASLTHVPRLKVKSRNSVFRYKDKDVDVQRAGKELGVDALVTGRVVQHGDMVQVTAGLTKVQDNTEVWGEQYERKASDILALQQQIAGDIADKLRSKLSGTQKQQVTKQGTANPEAYQLYVKGRYYWNKRTAPDLKTAVTYFLQAIDKDPAYAEAWAGLADGYGTLSAYGGDPNDLLPKAVAAAQKALELDPALARPHAGMAAVKAQYYWDFAGAEAEFRKAIELDPSDATAHQWYSETLCGMGGRAQEAIEEANRAHELDPLSPVIVFQQGQAYTAARQYDKAIEILKKLVSENPTFGKGYDGLAGAYWGAHRFPESIEAFKKAAQLQGDAVYSEFAAALDRGYRAGGRDGADRAAAEVALQQRKRGSYVSAYSIAASYADMGDKEHAFQWLNTAYQEHDVLLYQVRIDFNFDSLRSDPRYADLVRKIGLPPM